MNDDLKRAIQDLRKAIASLPSEQRTPIIEQVNKIRRLTGMNIEDLEAVRVTDGCGCGPQGEPGIVPIW